MKEYFQEIFYPGGDKLKDKQSIDIILRDSIEDRNKILNRNVRHQLIVSTFINRQNSNNVREQF
jgi:hypothetical protein